MQVFIFKLISNIDLEVPEVNLKLVHERGSSTQLHFLGFKLLTNMTVRPVMDIFKNLLNFSITHAEGVHKVKDKKVFKLYDKMLAKHQALSEAKGSKPQISYTKRSNKDKLLDPSKRKMKYQIKIDKRISEDAIIDETLRDSTPKINIAKPLAKEQEFEPQAPNILITPTNDSEYNSKEINRRKYFQNEKKFKKPKYSQKEYNPSAGSHTKINQVHQTTKCKNSKFKKWNEQSLLFTIT